VSVPSVQWGAVAAPSKAPTNLPHSRFFGHPHPAHGAVAQPFTWNAAYGYEWDCFAGTGLYHVGARAYDPRTARWLQRDPIDAASGDPNLYRYCGNDPVNSADPSGLRALDNATHFVAGWGDRLTNDLTKHIRDWLCDRLDLPRWEPRDPCDEWYLAGRVFGAVHDYALTRGAGRAGGALRAANQQKGRVHSRYADGTPVYENKVQFRRDANPLVTVLGLTVRSALGACARRATIPC